MCIRNRYIVLICDLIPRWILDSSLVNFHLHDNPWRYIDSCCMALCIRNRTRKTTSIFIINKLANVFSYNSCIPSHKLKLWLRSNVFILRYYFNCIVLFELLHNGRVKAKDCGRNQCLIKKQLMSLFIDLNPYSYHSIYSIIHKYLLFFFFCNFIDSINN